MSDEGMYEAANNTRQWAKSKQSCIHIMFGMELMFQTHFWTWSCHIYCAFAYVSQIVFRQNPAKVLPLNWEAEGHKEGPEWTVHDTFHLKLISTDSCPSHSELSHSHSTRTRPYNESVWRADCCSRASGRLQEPGAGLIILTATASHPFMLC